MIRFLDTSAPVYLAAACEILAVAPDGVAFGCFDSRLSKAAKVLGLNLAWSASA